MLVNLDCPIEMLDYNLYKSKSSGKIYSSFTFNNLSSKVIKAIKIKVYCYNQFNEPIKKDRDYLDASLEFDKGLGPKVKKKPTEKISLYVNTRKIDVDVEMVLFNDGTIWNNDSSRTEKVELFKVNDLNLLDFLKNHVGNDAKYFSKHYDDKWSCTCGRFNYEYQTNCVRCGRSKAINLSKYSDKEKIENEKNRNEAEIKKNERKQQEERNRQEVIKKRRTKKVILYSSITCFLLLIIGVSIFGYITKYTFSWENYQLLKDKDNKLIE